MSPQVASGNAVRIAANAQGASVSCLKSPTDAQGSRMPEDPGFMADCNPLLARARCILGRSLASCAAAG